MSYIDEETRKILQGCAVLDSCSSDGKEEDKKGKPCFDSLPNAQSYAVADIALKAAASVQQWAETDDLDEGEGYADRLFALVVGIADENHDGEITPDEEELISIALDEIERYLKKFGVAEDDIAALLDEGDEDAAVRVRDFVASSLPDGEDESLNDIDTFVFGRDGEDSIFDSAVYDASYKAKYVVRGGKKVRRKVRVSGTVKLSARQKMGLKKARMKSHSALANLRRAKSMRMREKAGLVRATRTQV